MTTGLYSCALSLLLLLLSLQQLPSHGSDTLTANQHLSGNQKLISPNGNFALGFFQPAEVSNGKWYIGIWYNKIPVQTVVWVANREKPVSDPASSNLIISDDGNLVILPNYSEAPIWSTNINNNKAANSTVAVLLDTGNLVVRHGSNNNSIVLWQSFDDFTDTWLPGNKLSRNKKTGVVKRMISWKDRGDPTPGMFSIELDPKGLTQYILLWNSSVVYWASGNWTGNSFSSVPELSPTNSYPNSGYTFQFVDNDEETYFTYSVKGDVQIFTRAIVDPSGLYQAFVWMEAAKAWVTFFTQPKAKCSVYGTCGENSVCSENAASSCSCIKGFIENYPNKWVLNDHTTGCRRNVPLKCVNNSSVKKHDRFYLINNVKLPDNAHIINAANSHDCELICLSNCSCTAYSHNGSCLVWHNHLMNMQDSTSGKTDRIFIRLDASEIHNPRTKKWWIIGIVTGGLIILTLGMTTVYFLYKRNRIGSINKGDGTLISFKYSDLQFLTRNFSDRLGAGSFGSVFKGVLPDTTAVAVKKLEGSHQGEKQFRAEVSTIGNIHHLNLIRLLGFCSEGARRMLVYEYMPNNSLDKHLFDSSAITLSWKIKQQIAVGIAKGLAYLHEECQDCIIHCDIKPENILLDTSFVPKVSDFGLAKLLGRDFSRVLTSMRGTVGYLAPEWLSGQAITAKADVFSYGMMLFEIMSGRRNLEHKRTSMEIFFPVLVARKVLEGQLQTLFSSELINGANVEELERYCKVACWCVQDNESSRPSMGAIVKMLEGSVQVEIPPVPRYLEVVAEGTESVALFSYGTTR